MQFRHAICARTLEPQDDNEIALQLSGLMHFDEIVLIINNNGRRFDFPILFFHRRYFHNSPAKITLQEGESAVFADRLGDRCQYLWVQAFCRAVAPDHGVLFEMHVFNWLLRISMQPVSARNRCHISLHQTG